MHPHDRLRMIVSTDEDAKPLSQTAPKKPKKAE